MFVLIGNKANLFNELEIKERDAKKFANILHANFFLSSEKNEQRELQDFLDFIFHDYIRIYNGRLANGRNRREKRQCLV